MTTMKDKNGNINCKECENTYNSTWCNNSTLCDNSTGCDNSTRCDNSTECDNSTRCNNSTWCDNSTRCNNSTWCDNSTGCNNSTYCIFCNELFLEKFMVFNKSVKTKERFLHNQNKIINKFRYKHPKFYNDDDKKWLKKNIPQYDEEVMTLIIRNSILPTKPKVNEK